MATELMHAEDEQAALVFAGGCLITAIRERVADVDTRFGAGMWVIAVATALIAIFRLICAARGVAVIQGAPDGMREALVQLGATPTTTASYDAARPVVVSCFFALGMTQLATAWFLSRGEIRSFLIAWSIALLIAGVAVAIQLSIFWSIDGLPSEFHGLLLQAATVPTMLAWYHNRQGRFQRRQ